MSARIVFPPAPGFCPFVCVPGPIPSYCQRPEGHTGHHAVQWNSDDQLAADASVSTDRASELAALRAHTEENTRAVRLDAACKALEKCGEEGALCARAISNRGHEEAALLAARDVVRALRRSLRDGSDEPRYAATGAALTALGALWAVS